MTLVPLVSTPNFFTVTVGALTSYVSNCLQKIFIFLIDCFIYKCQYLQNRQFFFPSHLDWENKNHRQNDCSIFKNLLCVHKKKEKNTKNLHLLGAVKNLLFIRKKVFLTLVQKKLQAMLRSCRHANLRHGCSSSFNLNLSDVKSFCCVLYTNRQLLA